MPKKSTTTIQPGKIKKPRSDFPLFPHASGRWAKKVRGAFAYFGRVSDDTSGQRALALWLDQKDDLLAGRKPRKASDAAGVTVKELCDGFLTAKESLVSTGELAQRTFDDYLATCVRLAETFGRQRIVSDLRSEDFDQLRTKLGRRWSPVTLNNEIGRVRVVFRWGYESELLDRPVRFGAGFKRPSQRTLRMARAAKGPKFFEAAQIRKMIDGAGDKVKAMILLGINCGLGNADCARLRLGHLDLNTGWLDYPRPKTGVARRCPLWSETVKAIDVAIANRPAPKTPEAKPLVFVTKYGRPWREDANRNSPLSHEFAKLCDELDINRNGGFYSLRHVVETIGDEIHDKPALDLIMGHAPEATDMGHRYRERIGDDRLLAVTNHVRKWLWPQSSAD